MIVLWIKTCLIWLAKLFIPPKPPPPTMFDINGICPMCKSPGRKVECVVKVTAIPQKGKPDLDALRVALLMWTCAVCQGYTFTRTCIGDDADKIHGREISGL